MGFFFFFQAEDGIRDYKVTGVQTCALPIYDRRPAIQARGAKRDDPQWDAPIGAGGAFDRKCRGGEAYASRLPGIPSDPILRIPRMGRRRGLGEPTFSAPGQSQPGYSRRHRKTAGETDG